MVFKENIARTGCRVGQTDPEPATSVLPALGDFAFLNTGERYPGPGGTVPHPPQGTGTIKELLMQSG